MNSSLKPSVICAVEDNTTLVKLTEIMLRRLEIPSSYEIQVHQTAQKAINEIVNSNRRLLCAFVDLQLNLDSTDKMRNGENLLKEFAKYHLSYGLDEGFQEPLLIAVSGADERAKALVKENGVAHDFLVKPISSAQMQGKILQADCGNFKSLTRHWSQLHL